MGSISPSSARDAQTTSPSGAAEGMSLADYQRLDVGFTEFGIQVWCRRHDVNVVHVNFGGARFEADFRCLEPKPGGKH